MAIPPESANGHESLEAQIARIDERTELMLTKLNEQCAWKAEASQDIYNLKKANLANRVGSLENWRWALAGAISVIVMLIGWDWIRWGGLP